MAAGLTDIYAVGNAAVQQLGKLVNAINNLGTIAPTAVSYVVASLPAATSVPGTIAQVTDGAAALAWGATVTGGGGARYLVWSNGTNWTVVGK